MSAVQLARRTGIDLDASLLRLYSPTARFRGSQRRVLEDILAGTPRILSIMRTGSGKSLTFMLPASAVTTGVTIVVVPKLSLRDDMVRRYREADIRGGR
jgi:superfamily II DNA helicase RecQ